MEDQEGNAYAIQHHVAAAVVAAVKVDDDDVVVVGHISIVVRGG